MSFYTTLNLDPKCTLNDIKNAYKQLARKYHPDKSSHQDGIFKVLTQGSITMYLAFFTENSSKF